MIGAYFGMTRAFAANAWRRSRCALESPIRSTGRGVRAVPGGLGVAGALHRAGCVRHLERSRAGPGAVGPIRGMG